MHNDKLKKVWQRRARGARAVQFFAAKFLGYAKDIFNKYL
jgi:hypothetical protein